MNKIRRLAAVSALITVGALWLTPAAAATYTFNGTVVTCPAQALSPCGTTLNISDAVTGSLVIDDLIALPNAVVGFADVMNLNFILGGVTLNDTLTAAVAGGSLSLDAAGDIIGGSLNIIDTAVLPPSPVALSLTVGAGTWTLSRAVPTGLLTLATGTGSFESNVVVPIPGALLLLGPALLSLGFVRRRR